MSTTPYIFTARVVILLNFVLVFIHSIAHEVLKVRATQAQLAFIVPVVIIGPIVSSFLFRRHYRAASALMFVTMIGSFVFGLYYHFIAMTIDHVSHVARLHPAAWTFTFIGSAYLMALIELFGTLVALRLCIQPCRRLTFHGT